ncbi:uncharacterized protein [Macrobrachium rosenbergii]|uniref:uncharacterized protein n=1 Tax=Macrobrachium rosenbergii TaxID=79674 RepID=UPI0034D5238E
MSILNKMEILFCFSSSRKTETDLSSSTEERRREALELRASKPTCVPVIFEEHLRDGSVKVSRAIMPYDFTVSAMIAVVRESTTMMAGTVLLCSVKGERPAGSETLNRLYTKYPEYDGHLHLTLDHLKVKTGEEEQEEEHSGAM